MKQTKIFYVLCRNLIKVLRLDAKNAALGRVTKENGILLDSKNVKPCEIFVYYVHV